MQIILLLLSRLYGLGVRMNRLRMQRKPRHRFAVPVISVGNITVGGTGKTEAVALICGILRSLGLQPGILSRGYGRKSRQSVLVVSRGKGLETSVQDAGDEPALLAKRLYDVPVIVGKDRTATGKIATNELGCNVLVLDDGFQRRDQVYRDLDIVLIDAGDPFGEEELLPAGRLREPLTSLKEADVMIITRADQYPLKVIYKKLEKIVPQKLLFTACHTAKQLVSVNDHTRQSLDYLNERKTLAVSGIARPLSFEKSLEKAGARISACLRFQDHHWFTRQDRERIAGQARSLGAMVVTTSKDAVRMPVDEVFKDVSVWALEIEMEILSPQKGLEKLLETVVAEKKKNL
ncbi:tetraacyldisaccharide 4'-kinase [bacterium]|nr:tetraacyldisaccharide 4'-kinase [bacterium]